MAKKIDDLRDHLFETLAALRDKDKPMELDRARAIADVGRVIVESAKVEVDFLKATGAAQGTGFIPEGSFAEPPRRLTSGPTAVRPFEACVLCGWRLQTAVDVARGLCDSCIDRPEAKRLPRDAQGKAIARTA